MSHELHQAMKVKLKEVGLAHEDIHVFGQLRLNVHIVCLGRETAGKWVQLLAQVMTGARINCVAHTWEAKINKNTVLKPTRRRGFLICAVA